DKFRTPVFTLRRQRPNPATRRSKTRRCGRLRVVPLAVPGTVARLIDPEQFRRSVRTLAVSVLPAESAGDGSSPADPPRCPPLWPLLISICVLLRSIYVMRAKLPNPSVAAHQR